LLCSLSATFIFPIIQAQNIEDGPEPNGKGIVYRVNQDDDHCRRESIRWKLIRNYSKYFACGIRIFFVMDVDPVTRNFWNKEIDPDYEDEMNNRC
jgi:aldose sugar dehydrogenase